MTRRRNSKGQARLAAAAEGELARAAARQAAAEAAPGLAAGCTSKAGHPSRPAARQAAGRTRRYNLDHGRPARLPDVYRCELCGLWHLGRPPTARR